MARDCDKFSPKAREIFKKLEPFFPPDPLKNPKWFEDGKIKDNWDYDLRKSADRDRLKNWYVGLIGTQFVSEAGVYQRARGKLDGFEFSPRSDMTKDWAELVLILNDLDFQIETMDVCEECGWS